MTYREPDNWQERMERRQAEEAMQERQERNEATAVLVVGSFVVLLVLCGLLWVAAQ